jgi:predicted nucleotidyltransferase
VAIDAVQAQSNAAIAVLRKGLVDAQIVAVYLYGSAMEGGLRPNSDLDLFAVTDRPLTPGEKASVVEGLLPISSRETRPPAWRPLELTIVAQREVRPWRYPPRMELQYGEWLRGAFLSGAIEPETAENPDLCVVIAMVRQRGRALIGPAANAVLDAVPSADLNRGMVDGLPSLLDDLGDDTRNVLLTLARIWATVATGKFRSKDDAADWALSRLPEEHRPILTRARNLYRAGGDGDPWDEAAVPRRAVRQRDHCALAVWSCRYAPADMGSHAERAGAGSEVAVRCACVMCCWGCLSRSSSSLPPWVRFTPMGA